TVTMIPEGEQTFRSPLTVNRERASAGSSMQLSTWELEHAAAYRRHEAMADAERSRLLAEAEVARPGRVRQAWDWCGRIANCVRTQSTRREASPVWRQQRGCVS
ncbi:MAG TPA: hypothetical protein VFQ80_09245, partial [Thermomicrobiales bacterium]|nr:hypothetical protein [Thermomicrobiales bacterium]